MKILTGILNWGRTHRDMKKIPDKLLGDVIICTDNPDFWGKRTTIEAVESIAASKNKIIQYAKDNNYDYLFIIEDDIMPINKNVQLQYKSMMDNLDLNIIMYGYDTHNNKVFKTKSNPVLIIKDFDGSIININRFPCSSMIGFKIFDNMKVFDENLQVLETDYLLNDANEAGLYPFIGFYFDIDRSWEKFKKIDIKTIRTINNELIRNDQAHRGNKKVVPNFSADSVLNYINDKTNKVN